MNVWDKECKPNIWFYNALTHTHQTRDTMHSAVRLSESLVAILSRHICFFHSELFVVLTCISLRYLS